MRVQADRTPAELEIPQHVIPPKNPSSVFAIQGGVWYSVPRGMRMMGRQSARVSIPPWVRPVLEPSVSVISCILLLFERDAA